ncbi:MAG: hypothetical protein ACQEXJ_14725 [Myxococcota bacterium]
MKALAEDLADRDAANARFREQVRRLRFRYRCDSCLHAHHASGTCSLGFPNEIMKGGHEAILPNGDLGFCKTFELSEHAD